MRAKAREDEEEVVSDEIAPLPPPEQPSQQRPSPQVVIRINAKLLIAILVLLIGGVGLFFAKNLFVVAIVNGTPMSRFALIQELEKRSGKQALDAMIIKKLVNDELQKKNVTISDEEVSSEIQKLEAQVSQQGSTLEAFLDQQGIDRAELSEQIGTQKKIEKLFTPTVTINNDEVATSIKEAKITIPEGEEGAVLTAQIKEQLRQQKIGREINKWIEELKSAASIQYLKQY